ncbi:hypothetical protein HDV63DRAFT_396687 [Trichoderma sp. SZMC 28014]
MVTFSLINERFASQILRNCSIHAIAFSHFAHFQGYGESASIERVAQPFLLHRELKDTAARNYATYQIYYTVPSAAGYCVGSLIRAIAFGHFVLFKGCDRATRRGPRQNESLTQFNFILLYLFYKRFFPDPTPAAPTPPILELPDELVLCIANHLAPYDQFLLSRTCRTMRRLLSRDWNAYLRSRTPSERNEFLVAVAFGMPNHWACENCGQLHGIDLRDLPSKKTLPHCVQPTNNGARSWAGYNLEYHHIQLALKLSDRGINEDYLQSLLSARRFTSYRSEMTISYTARPRIAQGHFLLYERAVFGDGYCRATYSSIQQSWISICPHLAMMQSPLDYRRMLAWLHQTAELYRAVSQAIQDPSHEVRRHCRWCATDYSLLYHQHTGQLILSAWHDFGAAPERRCLPTSCSV